MKRVTTKHAQRTIRHARIRARVSGTAEKPRLNVYRSNRTVFAQLIDDVTGRTLVSVSEKALASKEKTKLARAKQAGLELARRAKEQKISRVVFDRGGFTYAGRVKEFAEGAREGGLEF